MNAPPPLRARFVRTAGEPDRVYVRRSDGSEVHWPFPSMGGDLPHDAVHLLAESFFGMHQGFWGRVDDGVDPAAVNALANRTGGPDKYAGFGSGLDELYLAEALAGASWGLPGITDEDRHALIADSCRRAGIELPSTVTPAALGTLRTILDGRRAEWRALASRGTLELEFQAVPAA